MEVALLHAGQRPPTTFRSPVRCDEPDRPQGADPDEATLEANEKAPPPDEVWSRLLQEVSGATVVIWGGMAYRFYLYAGLKQLPNLFGETRVLDLQAALVMHLNLKTADCRSPRGVLRLLDLPDVPSQGALPTVQAMNAIFAKLVKLGWTPESTPDAFTDGEALGPDAEEERLDRWEQMRERQNNLGIERRPVPAVTPAYIVLDEEHVWLRQERFTRLIEIAMVVAHRDGDRYRMKDEPFTSLVQVVNVEDTTSHSWEITGIDREAVRRAPPLAKVMAKLAAAAPWDSGVLITWGADDASLLTQNCVKSGIESPIVHTPLVDLQKAFSRFYGHSQAQISLENAAAFLGMDPSELNLHRALVDATVTWHVLERMLADGWTPGWRSRHGRPSVTK